MEGECSKCSKIDEVVGRVIKILTLDLYLHMQSKFQKAYKYLTIGCEAYLSVERK